MQPATEGHRHTTRREFSRWLAASASAAGLVVLAGCGLVKRPGAPRVSRIGYLGSDSQPGYERYAALVQGLREWGYVENENLIIERRLSQDQTGVAFQSLAAELCALSVQVIVTSGTPSVVSAANATQSIPIVAGGPHRSLRDLGLVTSLAHPGSNVTGLEVDVALDGKRVELLLQTVQHATRFGVLRNPATPGTAEALVRMQETAAALGLEMVDVLVNDPAGLERAIDRAAQLPVDGVIVIGDFVFGDPSGWRVGDLAVQARLPAIYTQVAGYVDQGGLMAYTSDYVAFHHRAASYVDKLLQGADPAKLPVEQTASFEFAINLGAARRMGLIVPQGHVLLQATRVIE